MPVEWKISPRSNRCHSCGRCFVNGETCYSSVGNSDSGELSGILDSIPHAEAKSESMPELRRFDFCENCRKKFADIRWISVWQSKYFVPESPMTAARSLKENAESLIRRLADGGHTENDPVVFLLAIMLERKRVLVEKDVKHMPDGSILRIYENRKTGESLFITVPELSEERIPELAARIENLLSSSG